jgi:predicted ATPase
MNTDLFVVISGCSSGGKSTLVAELGRCGYETVQEPGRRIVREEILGDGLALPWVNGTAFARRAIALSLADRAAANGDGRWVFFDRGLIDAASALEHLTGEPVLTAIGRTHRYHQRVFLAPPWPEIYQTDHERRHDLDAAVAEYRRLLEVYPALGYQVIILPKVTVSERVAFVLSTLARQLPCVPSSPRKPNLSWSADPIISWHSPLH